MYYSFTILTNIIDHFIYNFSESEELKKKKNSTNSFEMRDYNRFARE